MMRGNEYPVTKLIIVINTLVFLVTLISPDLVVKGAISRDNLSNISENPLYILTPITSLFIHGGPIHLILSLITLYFLGRYLESKIGSLQFTLTYLISGMVGSLFFLVLNEGYAVGSSGAILGVISALTVLEPDIVVIFLVFPMRLVVFTVLFTVATVIFAIFGIMPEIAHTAHLGGILSGILIGLYLKGGKVEFEIGIDSFEEKGGEEDVIDIYPDEVEDWRPKSASGPRRSVKLDFTRGRLDLTEDEVVIEFELRGARREDVEVRRVGRSLEIVIPKEKYFQAWELPEDAMPDLMEFEEIGDSLLIIRIPRGGVSNGGMRFL
ncbi:hypothetical protein DRN52_04185 [Thermococci archaeon]|nr:MAG: hypothetical protein DRN52_04185 [Thermococci archaeon]